MTFEEWWENEMDMIFGSEKHKADAMTIANRAWNVAVREMVKQEEKTQDNKPFKADAESPPRCLFCGGKYFHEKTCKLSTYRTA